MQLTLRGDDRLAQFRIGGENKCWILLVQRGESRRNLVFLAPRLGLERGVKCRLRVDRHWQLNRPAWRAKRIAGAFATVEKVNLPDPFGDASRSVEQVRPDFHRA